MLSPEAELFGLGLESTKAKCSLNTFMLRFIFCKHYRKFAPVNMGDLAPNFLKANLQYSRVHRNEAVYIICSPIDISYDLLLRVQATRN